jgi:hypothetical protein
LSVDLMAAPHLGQCDAGQIMDSRRGTRCITTLRKLPTTRPSRPITTTIKLRLRAAQTCGSDAGVPSHLEPDGRTPARCHEPGYPAGEGLLFERRFLSSAFSLATTFYCAAPTGRRVVPQEHSTGIAPAADLMAFFPEAMGQPPSQRGHLQALQEGLQEWPSGPR